MTDNSKYPMMTNFTLAIVYNEQVEDEAGTETLYVNKVNKFNIDETVKYETCVERTKNFIIDVCGFKEEEIPAEELEGLITNFGMWDEKEVTYGLLTKDGEEDDTSEDVKLPFLQANMQAAKTAFDVKKEKLVERLEDNANITRPKGIKFTEAEATSGRERVLQLMSATVQSL